MNVHVGSQFRELSSFRFGAERTLIPYDSQLKLYSDWPSLVSRLRSLSADWPACAASVDRLRVSRWLPKLDYAHARVQSWSTVSGSVTLSRAALRDELIEARMIGLHDLRWTVCDSLSDVLTHEWGHLLTEMLIACKHRSPRTARLSALPRLISRTETLSGYSRFDLELSFRGAYNDAEFLAEAFTDAEKSGSSAHPFSQALHSLLVEEWSDLG